MAISIFRELVIALIIETQECHPNIIIYHPSLFPSLLEIKKCAQGLITLQVKLAAVARAF